MRPCPYCSHDAEKTKENWPVYVNPLFYQCVVCQAYFMNELFPNLYVFERFKANPEYWIGAEAKALLLKEK